MKFYFYLLMASLAVACLCLLGGVLAYRFFPKHRAHTPQMLKWFSLLGLIAALVLTAFVTNFPLPHDFSVYCARGHSPSPKFDAFSTVKAAWHYIGAHDDFNWIAFLKRTDMVQFGLNLFLLAPFVFFLRTVWPHALWKAIVISFCVSLAIELTQLTAVWGFAPCRYRTFDLEDLLANTMSGLFGWCVYVLIAKPLALWFANGLNEDVRA